MPEIVYTNRHLVNEHGVKPRKVSESYAKKMVQKGFARVINSDPKSNPGMQLPEHPIKDISKEEVLSGEQSLYTFVSWLENEKLFRDIVTIGDDCGFKIRHVTNDIDDISYILISDIVIINIGDVNWSYDFKYSLRVSLFQRSVPFVVYWHNPCEDLELARQFASRSRLNIFDNHELAESMKSEIGGLMHPYMIYKDFYDFWREISKVIV